MTDSLRAEFDLLLERVRKLEAAQPITMDLLDHASDDVIKLEEYAEEDRLRMDEQALRIVRLELAMGIAIAEKEVKG